MDAPMLTMKQITPSTVAIAGIVDANIGSLLHRLLSDFSGTTLRLDFAEVYRINSMGIAGLLKFLKAAQTQGTIVEFAGVSDFYRSMFQLTRIATLATLV